MIVTDPPYGVNYAAKNAYLNRNDRGNRIQKAIANDALSATDIKALFETSLRQARAYAARGAACYATVPSGPLLPYFIAGFEGYGYAAPQKHELTGKDGQPLTLLQLLEAIGPISNEN